MQAFIQYRYGSPEAAYRLETKEKPVPGSDELLVRVTASGINFADLMARRGLYKDAPELPFTPGFEVTGIVEETGENVLDFRKEQRVVAFTRFGGYASYVCVPAQTAATLPDEVTDAQGIALATQYCTAYVAAIEYGNMRPGETVLIHSAAGGVGTALGQLATYKQCFTIGTVSTEEKKTWLQSTSLDEIINYSKDDYATHCLNTFQRKPDLIFNAHGGNFFKKDRKILNAGGRLVCYGASERLRSGPKLLNNIKTIFAFGFIHPVSLIMNAQSIMGINLLRIADNKPEFLRQCLMQVVDLCRQGHLHPVANDIFTPEEIEKAHQKIESRNNIGKVLIKWENNA